jgi:hypothetical protein
MDSRLIYHVAGGRLNEIERETERRRQVREATDGAGRKPWSLIGWLRRDRPDLAGEPLAVPSAGPSAATAAAIAADSPVEAPAPRIAA